MVEPTITDLSKPITSLDVASPLVRPSADDLKPEGGSFVRGRTDVPLWRKTVFQVLQETANRHGHRDAAIFCAHGVRWSWSELVRKCDDLASGLLALGIGPGDRVGIWSPNRPEWLLTQFATARIGAILVNINPAYRSYELEYALNKSGCTALVLAESFKSSDYVAMLREVAPELSSSQPGELSSTRLKFLKHAIVTGESKLQGLHRFSDLMTLAGPAHRMRLDELSSNLDPDDPINIQFTSGTTGSPKGATLTHYNIVNNARFVVQTMRFSEAERLCIPVPLYHCFGMVMGVLGCAATGAAMVFPDESFDAKSTLGAVDKERCTALYGVPTMFVALLDAPEFASTDFGSLRTGCMAGAPCPIEIMKRVVGEMNMREVTIAYGMTETSPVSFQCHADDPLDKRVSTVGRIHPHVEVKIVDEQGKVAPVGERGELCTRGYSVMREYWEDDARTSEAIDAAGWMHSGDLATIDADGYCEIVGRVKDMLIRGGENIYPREVEEFLFTHPNVAEAQVFGVPDDKYGEEVCAWIVLKPGANSDENEIREFCRGQIAHYKIPRFVRFKTEIPMTVTGKPQKFIMRDQMMEELAGV
ncbi:MAG: AMP-binding protein [Pseudomonadota bacterium]